MTNINGQFNLFLTAENAQERATIEELRKKLKPLDFASRQLNPSGTGMMQVSAVPEPHEWALMFTGTFSLFVLYRKRVYEKISFIRHKQ